jgi:hypothetical protein
MEKVLIYATAIQGSQEASAYEEAINEINKGNQVLFLYCDKSIGGCNSENPSFHKGRCKICTLLFRKRMRKYLPKEVVCKAISDYWDEEVDVKVKNASFKYNTAEDYRKLMYDDVSIGYGAMSSYITLTRNMDPQMKDNVVSYLDKLLFMQVRLTELFKKALDDYCPDKIIFHNGRLAQYKPILNICQNRHLHFLVTESLLDTKGYFMKNYFENSTPHDVHPNTVRYEDFWKNYPETERIKESTLYFENKRGGGYTSEKVFTGSQISGKMPDNWDSTKRHIIIYNSSEDEYCAINKEVDEAALFPSQNQGISEIVNRYAKDPNTHIYLRIHPNLRNIKYSYYTDIYKIKADNFFIIPPESPVSSYTLLDYADLVIVFGSTIGLEATYFGKPSICLAYALYSELNVSYIPKTKEELWSLIEDVNLKPLDKNNCLKYSLFYISDKHDRFEHTKARNISEKHLGMKAECLSYVTLFNSSFFYKLFSRLIEKYYYSNMSKLRKNIS